MRPAVAIPSFIFLAMLHTPAIAQVVADQFQTYEQIIEKGGATRPFNTGKGLNDELIKEINADLTKEVKLHEFSKPVRVERIDEAPDYFRVKIPESAFVSGPNRYVVRQWLFFPKSESPIVPALSPGQEIVASGPMSRCELVREKQKLILIVDIRPTTFTAVKPIPAPNVTGTAPVKATAPVPAATERSKGIQLDPGWNTPLQGGRDTIEDLERILEPFVQPFDDNQPAPLLKIFEEVTYLMPLEKAAALVGAGSSAASRNTIACPGFPKGLFYSSFDGLWLGHYHRLYIVTDRADHVVSLQFVDESPKESSLLKNSGLRTYNFVNTRKKASGTVAVHYLAKEESGIITVHTGLYSTERNKMLEDVVWLLPKQFASLIRFCSQRDLRAN